MQVSPTGPPGAAAHSPAGVRWRRIAGPLLVAALLANCADTPSFDVTPGAEKAYIDDMSQDDREALRAEVVASLKRSSDSYALRVGDSVRVLFHVRPRPKADYVLQTGDTLAIHFPPGSADSAQVRVQPDGWLALPESVSLPAAGLSLKALNAQARDRYEKVFQDARPAVWLQDWTLEETRLIADLETVGDGKAQVQDVMPDGRLALPFLKPVMAEGTGLSELGARIDAAYAALGLDVSVSVSLAETVGTRLFIFGEVKQPGMIVTKRPQTVLMTIAQAGGLTDSGRFQDIRVFYTDKTGTPHLRRVNLASVMENLTFEEDMPLPDNAVVYVPPSSLAQVSRTLDLVLRQILFFQGFSGALTYEVFPPDTP